MSGQSSKNNNQIFLSVIQYKARAVLDSLIPSDAEIILLDYPGATNVGDSLIWLGEVAYLKSRKLKTHYVCSIHNYNSATLKKVISKKSVILMNGGGNFGTMWQETQDFRLKVFRDFPNIPIIQLPQTVYFDNDGDIQAFNDAVKKQGNFTLIVRSQPSYDFAKKSFDIPIYLCPDMAFFIGAIHHKQITTVDRFILARVDRESSGDLLEYCASLNKDLSYEVDDWLDATFIEKLLFRLEKHTVLLRKWFDPKNLYLMVLWNYLSLQRLKRGAKKLSKGQVVITDRLHAHILSILLGKSNVLIDNNYGKVKDFYHTWTFDYSHAKLVNHSKDIESAVDTLLKTSLDGNAVN